MTRSKIFVMALWACSILALFILGGMPASSRPLAPDPPHTIMINGNEWNVLMVRTIYQNRAIVGVTECGIRVIALTHARYAELADSFVHEVEHAMTCTDNSGLIHNYMWNNEPAGCDATVDEFSCHQGIYWSAGVWLDFIQHNPDAVKWLQESK